MNQPHVESAEDYLGLMKGGAEIIEGLGMTGANMYKTIVETKKSPQVEAYIDMYEDDYVRPSRMTYGELNYQ